MSTWARETAGAVYAAFRLCFGRGDTCFITRLPAELFINHVFHYLLVEDLVRLRQTNKGFYLLTHEPVIWRRYMRNLHGIPVSTLRPTFRFTEIEANHEIEHIVTAACAMERSWRRGFPHIRSERILIGQHLKVVDLKMVPGGKFLVASVRDRLHNRFFIEVYALDIMHGCRLLARMSTFHKVYDIQAKYMHYNDMPGIMISYTRRKFKNGFPQNFNLADLSPRHHIDIAYPLLYEACCVHMRLDNVEELIKPTITPISKMSYFENIRMMGEAPFRDVLRVPTDCEIHSPSLFETEDGNPCLGFIEDPSKIRLLMLNNGVEATLEFTDFPGHANVPHRVRAFRYLPCQHGFLVVRSIAEDPGVSQAFIAFEFYDFPGLAGPNILTALNGWKCADVWQLDEEITISDAEPPKKMGADHPEFISKEECPPTIWAFAPSSSPKGIAYWWFRPMAKQKHRNSEKTEYVYTEVSESTHFHQNRNFHELALPGAERTLLVEIDKGITEATPLNKLRRFHWPSDRFPQLYPTSRICEPITEIEPDCILAFTDICNSDTLGKKVTKGGGLSSIAWDENSGRICLSAENLDHIRVCDLAPVVEPHLRLAYQWRQQLIEPPPKDPEQRDDFFTEILSMSM